jgi:hypothetical protein
MSLIKANAVQIGQSPTATQNFTLAVPSSPDGTIKLARGNAGATTQDVMNVSNAGVVSFPQGLGNISNSTAIATGSTTARSLANRFADVVNVKDFGAVGDGVVDDTAAIQNAINSGKALVFLPEGNYKVTASITIPENVTLEGTLQPMQTGVLWNYSTSQWRIPNNATVISVSFGSGGSSKTNAAIRLSNESCVKGISFYYPSQNGDTSTPTQYPPTISLKPRTTGTLSLDTVTGASIESCHFCNPWNAIDFSDRNGRLLAKNLCGFAYNNFIYVDNSYEVNRLQDIQLNPINSYYGNFGGGNILEWQYVNQTGSALKIGKADAIEINNVFSFGFWNGIYISLFDTNAPNGIFIKGGGFEGCAFPVKITKSFRRIIFTGVQFGALLLGGTGSEPCQAITINSDIYNQNLPHEIKFVNCSVFQSYLQAVVMYNVTDVTFSSCGFYQSNSYNQGFVTPVIFCLVGTDIKINGCTIEQQAQPNGNGIIFNTVNGFVIENNFIKGITSAGSSIFIANSTNSRLNNNIELGTASSGVGQVGSTNVVSTNYVQY